METFLEEDTDCSSVINVDSLISWLVIIKKITIISDCRMIRGTMSAFKKVITSSFLNLFSTGSFGGVHRVSAFSLAWEVPSGIPLNIASTVPTES